MRGFFIFGIMIHRIKVELTIGFPGANQEDELEVELPDDATPEQIELEKVKALTDWGNNYIESWYEDID